MDFSNRPCNSSPHIDEDSELRRGPWTVEEDMILVNYIANHGEGRWNSLARCAGLKRTGKSCRLRWLNYLRPDVRRGNITPEEQLMILELHSRWGNRWSKIAQHLPGRTDNEIKNYWRTRVQKHAKQLQCDVNSKQFQDTMRYIWMPRLLERIRAGHRPSEVSTAPSNNNPVFYHAPEITQISNSMPSYESCTSVSSSDESPHVSAISDLTDYFFNDISAAHLYGAETQTTSPVYVNQGSDLEHTGWVCGPGEITDNLWNIEDNNTWFWQHQQ
ncbi:hypothetical protein AMTRI_Chr02g262480 [Amborella trichopoda]|uniref:Uncharacterized protein n=1 Tax=Amborella trichopoda TaxID=13333 RepID=W1P5V4_AMBTC|nr:transcription factor MYB78 [Amborella trichopoda]ERN03288.1 hypothetical protein AMTR_s00003p00219710 [Amborella trichopoda]|eukprot:XP_006841613.1 transcription factor MYB78 [Amborella trichopoda]